MPRSRDKCFELTERVVKLETSQARNETLQSSFKEQIDKLTGAIEKLDTAIENAILRFNDSLNNRVPKLWTLLFSCAMTAIGILTTALIKRN